MWLMQQGLVLNIAAAANGSTTECFINDIIFHGRYRGTVFPNAICCLNLVV